MTPLQRINSAQGFFDLVVRLGNAVREGNITPEMLRKPIRIITGGPGIMLGERVYTPEELFAGIQNIGFSAVGITAMALDQALDEAMGMKDPNDTGQNGALRAIIYMLRCAFAHDIAEPQWCCAPKYQNSYSVFLPQSGLLTFNGSLLNGQFVRPEHFGGMEGYFQMMDLSKKLV